jgi:uncharacterized CHY-type Zn-finger protein
MLKWLWDKFEVESIDDKPKCPECGGNNTIVIKDEKFVCDQWYACMDCGNEFGQTVDCLKNGDAQALLIGKYVIEKCKKSNVKIENFIDGDTIEYLTGFKTHGNRPKIECADEIDVDHASFGIAMREC